MYRIVRTKAFEKSFRRYKRSGMLKVAVKESLEEAITLLASGQSLPRTYSDHALKGELAAYRECHIKGDLLLVYQKHRTGLILILIDLATHSYLFE